MSKIGRFDYIPKDEERRVHGGMEPDVTGEYVLYSDHARIVAELSPLGDKQDEYDEAADEAAGWNRILGNYQGKQHGWMLAAEAVLDMATEAWRSGDEKKATTLRGVSDSLKKHAKIAEFEREQTEAYAKQVKFEGIAEDIRKVATGASK